MSAGGASVGGCRVGAGAAPPQVSRGPSTPARRLERCVAGGARSAHAEAVAQGAPRSSRRRRGAAPRRLPWAARWARHGRRLVRVGDGADAVYRDGQEVDKKEVDEPGTAQQPVGDEGTRAEAGTHETIASAAAMAALRASFEEFNPGDVDDDDDASDDGSGPIARLSGVPTVPAVRTVPTVPRPDRPESRRRFPRGGGGGVHPVAAIPLHLDWNFDAPARRVAASTDALAARRIRRVGLTDSITGRRPRRRRRAGNGRPGRDFTEQGGTPPAPSRASSAAWSRGTGR